MRFYHSFRLRVSFKLFSFYHFLVKFIFSPFEHSPFLRTPSYSISKYYSLAQDASSNVSSDVRFFESKSEFSIDSVKIKAFKNTYVSDDFQLLILDKNVEYKIPGFFPTHLLITDDPKVNLDRVLDYLRPQKVICDGSNKPWNVTRWQKSCQKRNIPFINLNQQGAFPINL